MKFAALDREQEQQLMEEYDNLGRIIKRIKVTNDGGYMNKYDGQGNVINQILFKEDGTIDESMISQSE